MIASASNPLDGVTLRPRRDDDCDFLRALYAGTRTREMEVVPWSDDEKQAFLAMQFEAQTRHYDEFYSDAEFLIVETDDGPIGRLYLQRRNDEIRVVDIALVTSARSRGIGGALMRQVLKEARQRRVPCRIHVEADNPAMRLYRRLGFREVDENGVYRLMEWNPGIK